MGKSPAKWIKSVLLGKKSTGSHAAVITSDNIYNSPQGLRALYARPPLISDPVPVSAVSSGTVLVIEGTTSSVREAVTSPASQDAEKLENAEARASNDPEKLRAEQAAIKAQTAIRGYLARRAFRALRGIVRLQALVRGHLVRRQAIATLRSMQGIVKLQALYRAQRVRRSDISLEIYMKYGQRKAMISKSNPRVYNCSLSYQLFSPFAKVRDETPNVSVEIMDAQTLSFPSTRALPDVYNVKKMNEGAVPLDTWKEKVPKNAFICKLLSSGPVAMPLQVQYNTMDSNSVSSWLERWTTTHPPKPLPQQKKDTDLKSHSKRGSYAMETETGRQKCSARKNPAGGVEFGPTNLSSESEKTKRNLRKVSSSPAESVPEHPQIDLEKVKRNLRKVSYLPTESSDRLEVKIEKPDDSLKQRSNTPSDVQDASINESAEKVKKEIVLPLDTESDSIFASKSVVEGPVHDLLDNSSPVESHPLQSIDKEDNPAVTNGKLNSKEEKTRRENQKTSKRRASFSAKTEDADNDLQNTPPLPSYMARTESSKAKLQAQSPSNFSSDTGDRNGYTYRHSLPSSTNGKLSSHSPRTKRLVQASGKGGIKTDKSLSSSIDGKEKLVQVEWRR